MRDESHERPPDCDACAAAEANPASGLYRQGCPRCWERQVARMPAWQRREVYDAMTDAEARKGFAARVSECWQRLRGACASEATYTRTGVDG